MSKTDTMLQVDNPQRQRRGKKQSFINETQINQAEERREQAIGQPLLSILTPACNEAHNLPKLYKRICETLDSLDLRWEWIIIDDHSADKTFNTIVDLAEVDSRVFGLRLARNFGSHTAITCGLQHAKGRCAVIMAADLQDPPETLPHLLAKWYEGMHVVWAVRARREGERTSNLGFARSYYWLMHRVVGIKQIPATNADFFLIDRCVIEAFKQFNESNVSILALIMWMGFRQTTITYIKQSRLTSRSGWSLEKKLKLAIDSVTSFTYLPIRLMSYIGFFVALLGFIYAGFVAFNALIGSPIAGWSSLMLVILVFGGLQMLMIGILSEYLWRALDESRRRPRYLIENITSFQENVAEKQVD